MTWAVDAFWDIECAEWDQFLMGALWTRSDGVRVFHDPDDLADALLALPKNAQAWAHAGGRYDVLWLIDHLARRGDLPQATVSMSGSSATSVRFKDGPWLRDSARLVPMSLAKAAPIAGKGRAKGDPGIPCRCGRSCGGYCSISHAMPAKWKRSIEEYLVQDVELGRDVLQAIERYALDHGITLRGTIGGTAWATASEWCDLEDAEWDALTYRMARPGYMGGHCEVGRTRAARIWRYDRKSAYPASLLEPVPTGKPQLISESGAGRAFAAGRPGIYYARVTVPESYAPPLPYRYRNRLTYPHGTIEGAWSHIELAYAVESCGVKIERVTQGVVWPSEAPILAPYSIQCFGLRDRLNDDAKGSLGVWLKFLANSLTGKLGQSPDWRIVALGDYADDPRWELVGTSPHVWSREVWRIPQCAHVQFAATLTARARVELHEQIRHAGDHWVYSDTDSCFATIPLTRNIGDDLGDWAFEGEGDDWEAKAPKVYSYHDRSKGKSIAHAKGIPDGDRIEIWKRYARGELVPMDRGVHGLLTAARGDRLFRRRGSGRRLHESSEWCGARLRSGDRTQAPHVTDLARLG